MNDFFKQKVLPAVTLTDPESACLLAEALLEGGIDVLEVTFRTDAAVTSLKRITAEFPELMVGAGTITTAGQIPLAIEAGARFGLSPGLNEKVIRAARDRDFPFMPGVMTPSEIERALDCGCRILKLFPIQDIGGVGYIRSLEGPYVHTGVQFVPMGGINTQNMKTYLECSSVLAVGGSWLAPEKRILKRDVRGITEMAKRAVEIVRGV